MRFADAVLETSSTTGTGTFSLGGAVSGHQGFNDELADGDLTYYFATDGSNWEAGYGTLSSSPNQLTRDVVLASSNGDAAVSFPGGSTLYIRSAPSAIVLTSLVKTCKGSAAPAWLPAGGLWVDDTDSSVWLLKIKKTSGSVTLGRIDVTNGRVIFEGSKATDITSASSIDIGAASGDLVHITGTTTITALGTVTAGVERTLVFDGILTLTHNATSLKLFGGANIVTAAGDVVRVRSEGSGNWRQVGGGRVSGKAWVAIGSSDLPAATTSAQGAVELSTDAEALAMTDTQRAVTPANLAAATGLVLLGTVTATSGTSQAITDLPKCRAFFVVFHGVSSTNSTSWRVALSSDNGSNYGTARVVSDTGLSAGFEAEIQVWITGTGATGSKLLHHIQAGGTAVNMGTNVESTITGVINAMRFSPSSGSFDASGVIYVYGWR